ncbi:platelet binding [Diplodia corticola]|uniref:Platelet binding n=1 Tax=Diplodia corticola TaxID=236234 RepID=A0A1J9S032_9PEZI|nr:platelet binding [Diplodia corticola]OJD33045.1 platelet binding [Diplodia corticola]
MVGLLTPRDGTRPATIPPVVWIAVGVAGGIILVALICMIFLLVRATRAHKRLLADLEQRGIRLGQQHVQIEGNGVTKPRQVLRRNAFLPYNNTTGWGVLPSKESFGQSSLSKAPRTNQTPAIIEPVSENNHSSHKKVWPFHKRRHGPNHIKMERIKASRLSAIIESPKPMLDISPPKMQEQGKRTSDGPPKLTLGPMPDSPIERLCSASFGSSKPNSAPDLTSALRPAPLFSSSPVPTSSGSAIRSPKRRGRSNSVPSIYSTHEATREIHPSNGSQKLGRNFSLIYRQSGLAPENPVPPLPLRFGHARSVSNMDYSPSRRSASSFESATSSILVTASPDTQRSPHARMRQSPGHELHKSLVLKGPRPLPQLRARSSTGSSSPRHFRDESIRSNVAQFAVDIASSGHHSCNGSPEPKADGRLKIDSNSMGRLSQRSRSNNSLMGGAPSTPRRNSRTLVSSEGSPIEHCRFATHQDLGAHEGTLAQQLSRTSTNASSSCSSNGNPFRWDPAPMQSGRSRTSPEKKRSHRRQNCIRLSLTTGQVVPPVKPEDPSVMHGIEEEPGSMHKAKASKDGEMISLDTRPLPRPPSISVFSPEIRLSPTTIRASLTQRSPTLSLTKFNQENSDGSPRWRGSGISGSSAFSIQTFPSPAITDCSQPTLADSENDVISGAGATDEYKGPRKRDYKSNSPLLNHPVLNMPSAQVENECRPVTPPSQERKASQMDSPPCSPKTLMLNSLETTPVDLCKKPKLKTSTPPVPELPMRNPRRSKEISSPTRAGLTGPRTEPGRDLRKTVAALRRMNSDADDDSRTSRRYRQLGREATSDNLTGELETNNNKAGSGGGSSSIISSSDNNNGRRKYANTKVFSSPSKHFVPASTYSLVLAPSPHPSVAPSTMTTMSSTTADSIAAASCSAFSATTGRTSTTTAATATTTTTTTTTAATPPTSAAAIQKPPAFGLGLNFGCGGVSGGGGGGGGGLGCSSTSNNSLAFSTGSNGVHSFLGYGGYGGVGGDDSCTSLTDLILAEDENIFGRRELEMANHPLDGLDLAPPPPVAAAGAASSVRRGGSSKVWEDGGGGGRGGKGREGEEEDGDDDEKGFWESPSARQQREMIERREMSSCSSLSVYATPCGGEEEEQQVEGMMTTCGAGVEDYVSAASCGGGGGRASSEFFDSDAENRTPTGKSGGGVTVVKEESKKRRWTGRGGGGNSGARDRQREVLAPKVLISVQPPSEQSTPRSLYDSDGFLR